MRPGGNEKQMRRLNYGTPGYGVYISARILAVLKGRRFCQQRTPLPPLRSYREWVCFFSVKAFPARVNREMGACCIHNCSGEILPREEPQNTCDELTQLSQIALDEIYEQQSRMRLRTTTMVNTFVQKRCRFFCFFGENARG